MKKWFYLMLAAVLPVMAMSLASCNDKESLPNVDITLDVAQGIVKDGTIYVAQGDTIDIAAITVTNLDSNKAATVNNVTYYWDGRFYAPSMFSPFGMIFPTTENTPVGNHMIDITCNVLAVDKSIATAVISYPVTVVASPEDLPAVETPQQRVTSTTSLNQ